MVYFIFILLTSPNNNIYDKWHYKKKVYIYSQEYRRGYSNSERQLTTTVDLIAPVPIQHKRVQGCLTTVVKTFI